MPGIHFREVVCMLGIFGLFLQAAAGHILYLALHLESGSFPRPLPPDRERAAFADLKKGGAAAAQARDTLIRHNLRLVAHICKKYYAGNSAQDDMISIGTIGLIKAVDTFDPAKGKRFAKVVSGLLAEIIMVVGYFGYAGLILGNGLSAALSIPGNLVQGGFGIIVSTVVYLALSQVIKMPKLLKGHEG